MDKRSCFNLTIFNKISSVVVQTIEDSFYRYGQSIAKYPGYYIIGCLIVTAVSAIGLLRFYQEKHPLKLWIPPGSDFARDTEWLMSQFDESYRIQTILITAPDVLQPYVLQQLEEIHQRVVNASIDGITWEDVCFRIPVLDLEFRRKKRYANLNATLFDFSENTDFTDFTDITDDDGVMFEFDPSVHFNQEFYCSIVRNLKTACLSNSLLEFWRYDSNEMSNITKEDILWFLNSTDISPVFGHPMGYLHLLGGIKRNQTGFITSASSLISIYMVHVNLSAVNMNEAGNDAGTADWATGPVLSWEKKFLEVMEESALYAKGVQVFYEAGRSYGDISASTMFQDIDKLIFGIVMMFIYVQIIVSKFNWLEFRIILGSVGLLCVGLAFVVSCGLCSLIGIPYGPVHTALPFLLMGIGVDDMFVIMACWNNLTPQEKRLSLSERIGRTLLYAGGSITITSLTDILAFLVGAFTILPSLQSFCLYAAMGVLVIFAFQLTLFVACLVLDQRRVENFYNGIVICYKHKNYKTSKLNNIGCSQKLFQLIYSKVIFTFPGKVIVILSTLALGAVGISGLVQLKQEFDPIWFLPKSSYLFQFIHERSKYFPDLGKDASVYMGKINYTAELPNIYNLITTLKEETSIIKDVDDWLSGFRHYLKQHFQKDILKEELSPEEFDYYISKYLFSPGGAKYQKNFRFEKKIHCGEPASLITVSSIDFKFKKFHGPQETLPAMNRIKSIVRNVNFTTGDRFATVWGKIFATWVTDEVIDTEVYRNLILACICVMICTTLLIANFITCFLIFICVLFTLINVAGIMHYWGLTIDIVSCIGLELAAGLCVDYAAHVGHSFLKCSGEPEERALKVVTDMGPAIVSGGFSTLLALSVLSYSQSYIFLSFFKIFLLVVIFGLFHGMLFLPVVLSWVGPAPYKIQVIQSESLTDEGEKKISNNYNLYQSNLTNKPQEIEELS